MISSVGMELAVVYKEEGKSVVEGCLSSLLRKQQGCENPVVEW
jgi:hypothetical protein